MEGLSCFDRGMQEVSSSSRATNLTKLMERETENIRLWKVESERRMAEQEQDIQGKADIIARLQKQLTAVELEKDEALTSLKDSDRKCEDLVVRLEKFSSSYQRILKGVSHREKEEQRMKEQHESLVKEKVRLKAELEKLTQRFVNIQERIDELKDETEERFVLLHGEARSRENRISEISAELAATKESQLLAIEKVSFLEQEMSKRSASIETLRKEKDLLSSSLMGNKDRLQTQIKEAEKIIFTHERDLADRAREIADMRENSDRRVLNLQAEKEEESRRFGEKTMVLNREKTEIEERCRENQTRIESLLSEVDSLQKWKLAVESELTNLKEARDKLEEENRGLTEVLRRRDDDLAEKMAALDVKAEEARNLQESVDRVNEEAASLRVRLEDERDKSGQLEGDLKEKEQRVLKLESKVQELQSDAKKYQSEILFRHETLQQKEGEYTSLSRKYKEILEEKEAVEGELGEVKESLDGERVLRATADSAKEAALSDVASLGKDLEEAKEQINMSKQALDRAFGDKSSFESDCVQAKMANTALQRQLEASETKLKSALEAEMKLRTEAETWREERDRLVMTAKNAEAKLKADAEKNLDENRSEREKYDKVIDDIKAKHEEARKRAIDLENQVLDARKVAEDQAKQHQKSIDEMNKDKDTLRKYQKGTIDRVHNLLKAEELRLSAKVDELAAKDVELTTMKEKVAELKANLERVETQSKVAGSAGNHDEATRKRVAELEAQVKEGEKRQAEKIADLEKETRERMERVEDEKAKQKAEDDKKMSDLSQQVTDLKLNLDVKERECRGLTERVQSLVRSRESKEKENEKAHSCQESTSAASSQLADVGIAQSQPPTPSDSAPSGGSTGAPVHSFSTPSVSSSQQLPSATHSNDKVRTPGSSRPRRTLSQPSWGNFSIPGTPSTSGVVLTPRTPVSSLTTPMTPKTPAAACAAPFAACTPAKSTVPPPNENSPFIKKRSMASKSINVVSKKSKVTFGGETSRVISDTESQTADDSSGSGADKFFSKINPPTTAKTTSSGPLKPCFLASGSESFAAENTAAKDKSAAQSSSAAAPVAAAVSSAAAASSSSLSSVSSASTAATESSPSSNPTRKVPKKFAELRAKNEKIREAKREKREENKAKYGNKFNELKAKNEERARKKEARNKEAENAQQQQQRNEEDDGHSSDGTDWF